MGDSFYCLYPCCRWLQPIRMLVQSATSPQACCYNLFPAQTIQHFSASLRGATICSRGLRAVCSQPSCCCELQSVLMILQSLQKVLYCWSHSPCFCMLYTASLHATAIGRHSTSCCRLLLVPMLPPSSVSPHAAAIRHPCCCNLYAAAICCNQNVGVICYLWKPSGYSNMLPFNSRCSLCRLLLPTSVSLLLQSTARDYSSWSGPSWMWILWRGIIGELG